MRGRFAVLIPFAMKLLAQTQPAPFLVVYRDLIRPGKLTEYHAIEQDTARLMRQAAPLDSEYGVRFPNSYLAAEPLTGLPEVWFLTVWKSRRDYESVGKEYSQAPKALVEALAANAKIRAELTLAPMSTFATYRSDLGSGQPWNIGRDSYLVIATTRARNHLEGSVYEAEDHTFLVFRSARSRSAAEEIAARIGQEARVFEVRPDLSRPAAEWVTANKGFWAQVNTVR